MLNYIEENGSLRVTFPDQLDMATCELFREELLEKIRQAGVHIIFDLGNVSFISSEFLSICCIARNEIGQENLTITRIQPMIYRVFRTAGLAKVLELK